MIGLFVRDCLVFTGKDNGSVDVPFIVSAAAATAASTAEDDYNSLQQL